MPRLLPPRRWVLILAVIGFFITGIGLAVLVGSTLAQGRTFYVGPDGSDQNDGRTSGRAWQSFAPVNAMRLLPGDRILVEGGTEYSGTIRISGEDAGDPDNPVVVESHGSGRAIIKPGAHHAIDVLDTSGVVIRGFDIVGPYTGQIDGISLYNSADDRSRHKGITIEQVDISGFYNGIAIGSASHSSCFADVTIADSALHNNVASGLVSFGAQVDVDHPIYAHKNITVKNVVAYRNDGDPVSTVNTGSGIVLGGVDGAVITDCTAYENGSKSTAVEGPVGIWTHDSNNVVIEKNVSFNNRTNGADGGGFDLDRGVTNSVMQYNLSYGNLGAGFLLFTNESRTSYSGNVVRFNMSVNDARAGGYYGSITVLGGLNGPNTSGGIRGVQIYHNTVIASASTMSATWAPAVRIGGTIDDILFANNLLVSRDGNSVVQAADASVEGVKFRGNGYQAPKGLLTIQWNDSRFTNLDSWRADTGQEFAGSRPTGFESPVTVVDPRIPSFVTSAADRTKATGLRLAANSALIGNGRDLSLEFGISVGPQDFFGTNLSSDYRYDVGAAAWVATQ